MWFRAQSATWSDMAVLTGRMAGNERELRRKFWRKLQRLAASVPFAEDLLAGYYCAFDRQTPFYVKATLVGAIVYFVVPDRFIPKSLPLIAAADDAAVLAAAFKAVSSHINPAHREAARRTLARMRGATV